MTNKTAAIFLMVLGYGMNLDLPAQQDGDPVSIGTYRVIHSRALDEDRTLLIHLPRGYGQTVAAYPVAYLLYGNHVSTYFAMSVAAVDKLGSSGRTPPFILVGIMNTDRYRDLLPEAAGKPTGIGAFTRFLSEELFPFIEDEYRTKPFRILIGPQAGANFGLYSLMTNPNMFNAAILENPFRWRGGRDLMLEAAAEFFSGPKEIRRFLHISYRKGDELEVEAEPYLKKLMELREKSGWKEFRLELEYTPVYDEFLPPFRVKAGLKAIFDEYVFPRDRVVDSLEDILAFYNKLSAKYGYDVNPPLHVLSEQSYSLREREKTEEMLRLLRYMLDRDPHSGDALWQLGNHFERTGRLEKAIECYERMIRFMGSDAGMIKSRVDRLKRKIEERRKQPALPSPG